MVAPVLHTLYSAKTHHDIVTATSRFLEEDLPKRPISLLELGSIKVESIEDIENWIDRIQGRIDSLALIGEDEDRVDRLLSYLLVASIRARQLS